MQERGRCWSNPVVGKVGSQGGVGATLAAEQSKRQGQLVGSHRRWWGAGRKELSFRTCAGKW